MPWFKQGKCRSHPEQPTKRGLVRKRVAGGWLCVKCEQGVVEGCRWYCAGCLKQLGLAEQYERQRAQRAALRAEVVAAYGGKCACCGEHRAEFLQMDHVDGTGAEHRRQTGRKCGQPFYTWLRHHGYPAGFRVLCANCNFALGIHGHCPHERERAQAEGQDEIPTGISQSGDKPE